MHRNTILALTAAAFCAATAMLTSAGPLDPPPGAVSPTGRTLDEIFDAIGDLPAGDCGAAIPGENRGDGTLTVVATQQGTLPLIDVESYRIKIERPTDPITGLPTGSVRLNSLVITKNCDAVTPMLLRALALNENLPTVTLVLFDERALPYMEITLQNAIVTSYNTGMLDRCDGSHAHLEEVSFTYQQITWEEQSQGRAAQFQRQP